MLPWFAIVAAGFPAGLTPIDARIAEIKYAVEKGASEIDVVLNRSLVLMSRWQGTFPIMIYSPFYVILIHNICSTISMHCRII